MDRASDAATYIEHGNVVSIGHHSSTVLHMYSAVNRKVASSALKGLYVLHMCVGKEPLISFYPHSNTIAHHHHMLICKITLQ